MSYNSNIHHRRSIRLKGYDYSQAGLYFITVCVYDRKCLFGKIENDEMILNEFGTIAYQQWETLHTRFINMELDVFQIMPNHMHGIIALTEFVGATLAVAPDADGAVADQNSVADQIGAGASPAPITTIMKPKTIGDIVGAYKSLVANECLNIYKIKNETMGKLWQRNYHEHIIRDGQSYQRISDYIISNPKKWNTDKFYGK